MGASKGAGTPLPAPGRPGLLPMLSLTSWRCPASTSGWPSGTAAVPPKHSLPPTPASSSSSPPFPDSWHLLLSSAPWQSGCERLSLQRDSQHFAPCKERWESWHRDPASCAAPRPPPGFLSPARALAAWPEPPCPSGVPVPHSLPPHSLPLQHTTSVGSGWGQQQGLSPTSSSAPLARQQMLALLFPAEEYQSAHGHRLMLPASFWHC